MKQFVTLCVVVMLLGAVPMFGLSFGNDVEYLYSGPTDPGSAVDNPIRTLSIRAASYFLESHATVQEFLHAVEVSELRGRNFGKFSLLLDRAIRAMESSSVVYAELKVVAGETSYNALVIEQLKDFDYDGFARANGLHAAIFNRVRGYLGVGDANGLIGAFFSDTRNILEKLNTLKGLTDSKIFPAKAMIWDINQTYFDVQMFGQYATRVFNGL